MTYKLVLTMLSKPMVTNHVVKAHGDKLLKVKTPALDEKSGRIGMKSKNFGFIPNDMLQPGQYLIANTSKWTLTLQDKTNDEYDDEDNGDDDEEDNHHALYRTLL